MKRSDLSKIASASLLALSLVILPSAVPASAQTSPAPETNTENSGPTVDTTPFQETKDDANNLGWLGLIGLVGLANLLRQPKTAVREHDHDVASGSGTRF